jgi:hypothetical protein
MTQRLDPLEIVNTPPPKEDPRPAGMLGSGVNFETLNQARLAGNLLNVGEEFTQRNLQALQQQEQDKGLFGVGEDITGYDRDYVAEDFDRQRQMSAGGQFRMGQESSTDTRLGELGLDRVYQDDMYRKYVFNPNTGNYDYIDNTPSIIDQALPALIKSGVMGAATGGLGNALSSSLGLSTGVGKAIASTGLNAMFGEDIDLKNTVKNLAVSYGMDKIGDFSEAIKTGNDFTDNLLKDTVGSVAQGKDPKEALLKSLLKQGGDYVADALDLGDVEDSFLATLSDIDKEYLQPVKDYVEEAVGVDFSEAYDEIKDDVDGFLDKVPDQVKDLLEGYAKYKLGEATGVTQGGVVPQGSPQTVASLRNTILEDQGPVLTEYETLDNNLLQQLRI